MKKKKANAPLPPLAGAPPKMVYEEVSAVGQLAALCGGPLVVEMVVRGKPVKFVGRRLRPGEVKEVQLLLERALPPELPPEKEGEPARYDFRSDSYRRQQMEDRHSARAIAIYACFPAFRKEPPKDDTSPLTPLPGRGGEGERMLTREEIVEHMATLDVEDDVLATLFGKLTEEQVLVPVAAHVNFT